MRKLFKMRTAPLHHPKPTFHFIISSSTLYNHNFLANPQEQVMDFSQVNHNHKQPKRKQSPKKHSPGKRLTLEQVRLLERSFVVNKKLDPERKLQLAGELKVPPRQVAIWYQNRRARWKTQNLELDHSSLQLRLDSALEEKEKLQKDVEFLKGELRRAQDLIILLNNRENNPSSSSSPFSVVSNFNNCAVSTDERGNGSRSIYGDAAVNCCWVDDDDAAMWGSDLYACFMLTNGSNMDKNEL